MNVPSPGHQLDQLAWPQTPAAATLLVPLGSTEQHGPHLPAGTDAHIAAAVAQAVAARADTVHPRVTPSALLVAPPLSYGASGEHEQFPGTISIGHEALATLLVELGRSASRWAGRIVVVNAHGGNLPTVRAAVTRLRQEGRDVAWVPCTRPGADLHAGRFETSLMLAVAPWTVRVEAARAGVTDPLSALMPRLRAAGVRSVSPSGVLGDPSGASAREGRELLRSMAEEIAARLVRWAPGGDGELAVGRRRQLGASA